jgi:membrane-associated phospholipid phosphatase
MLNHKGKIENNSPILDKVFNSQILLDLSCGLLMRVSILGIGSLRLILLLCLCFRAWAAEYPYRASVSLDVPLAAASTVILVFGIYRISTVSADVLPYNRNDLLPWDRPFAGSWNKNAYLASNFLMVAGTLPLILGAGENFGIQTLMLYEVLALQGGLQLMVRSLKIWPRPFMLGSEGGKERENPSAAGSFYSGHTSAAFSLAVFTGIWFDNVYSGSSWSKWVWGGGLSAAALVGILRIAGGMHYPSDVLAGAAIGSLIGWIVPTLHRNSAPGYIGWQYRF